MGESTQHERFRERTVDSLVQAVRRGDYLEATQWLDMLAAVDGRFEFAGAYNLSGWEERARAYRAGERLPDPLSVGGAIADYRGLFGAVLRRSFDGVVLNARESRWILEVSDSFCALTGYEREELIGRTSVELGLVAEDAGRAEVTARADEGLEGLYETRLRRKDREIRLVEFSQQLLPGNELVLSIVRDVSTRKEAEEALRAARSEAEHANRAKSEFLSRMSHELRTPLNAILGFSQLLELEDLSAAQREYVEQVVTSGRRLLDLINEVLDIARIESGQLRVSPEPVSVARIASETVQLMRPLADQRNISLETSRDPEMQELHVMADRQRLGQVLLNLVSNAVKYNLDGGAVRVSCALAGEEMVRIVVTDTGPGIAPEKVPLLFTPFERLGAEQTDIEGTGLGLALSKSLVEAMGGRMLVQTAIGRGTKFSIELHAVAAPAPEGEAVDVPEIRESPIDVAASGTLLYIEDNISNVQLIEAILKLRPNVKLISAMTAGIGLELACEQSPHLILLDLQLPDEPGDTVLRRLRKDTRTANVPIVIASADATRGQIERLLAAGADDYLTKPIDVNSLLDIIDRLLAAPDRAQN